MTGEVEWVRRGAPHPVQWVYTQLPVYVGDPENQPGSLSLQSLTDVEGTTDALANSVLTKSSDGLWRPSLLGSITGVHLTHNQPTASTEWVVSYAALPFTPAGVRVFLSDGSVTQPGITDYPETKNLVLSFSRPRSGRAEVGA